MLADLFKQDDVMHRIMPVSGLTQLENVRDELATYVDLHTLILLNMGGVQDLPSSVWFADFSEKLTVHVIDSSRPQNLDSLYMTGGIADRIVLWDDGEADNMEEEKKAWEALQVSVLAIVMDCISSQSSTNPSPTQMRIVMRRMSRRRISQRMRMRRMTMMMALGHLNRNDSVQQTPTITAPQQNAGN